MQSEAGKTELNSNTCRHKDGSVCHCAADRLLHGEAVIESGYLFADRNEIQIRHEGQVYRLRVTRNGKLILNK
ncbi:MAG: hemin uptake protein HemP [Planctomycetaceae bacterium]|nr:MAG: hemin uptake protein HemP [Planctomycetaceae bacterium]